MNLNSASREQLEAWQQSLIDKYNQVKARQLNLDLTRGKPSADQLSLSNKLDGLLQGNYTSPEGVDTRNYGGLEGIIEARRLGSQMLGLPVENILAGGNSSLTLMFHSVMTAHLFGLTGPDSAWSKEGKVKFLCPVPGYDRHFCICEQFDIEMVNIPMTESGPDMDAVESTLAADPSIKGMWCVPKYSNPTGVIYSDETVERMAKLAKIAGANFRIFWDNAYAVHDLTDEPQALANIMEYCQQHDTENSVLQFASTSKITHAGSGIAFMGASEANLNGFKKTLGITSIGPDKVNQLRHSALFPSLNALQEHMQQHAAIIKPRFASVLKHLEEAFSDNDLGQWESAQGGYFISFDTRPGLAKKVVQLAADTGVKLTPAGATFPYGKDPQDSNIRIAPTVPSVEQVDEAMKIFVLCVQLASVQQALET